MQGRQVRVPCWSGPRTRDTRQAVRPGCARRPVVRCVIHPRPVLRSRDSRIGQ